MSTLDQLIEAESLKALEVPTTDPKEAARAARLRYVSDDMPGITRHRRGKDFHYKDPDGKRITDPKELHRIRSLAVPPAYTDVWICPYANGHIQATGRDARGRKQYRYHPRWREIRDETKYERMLLFGAVLPSVRQKVEEHLALPGLPREKVLAAVVRLMELTLERVGNQEYAKENNSFGLTTLRNRHVSVEGWKLHLDFKGKHGLRRRVEVSDRKLASIVRKCLDLPGYHLFQYEDEGGELRKVDSGAVNDYLREISGEDITAKDFRTWAATGLAIMALQELEPVETQAAAKKNVVRTVEAVAQQLGNTPAICRKCYIHPAVFESYMEGRLAQLLGQDGGAAQPVNGRSPEEEAVLAFLQHHLKVESEGGPAKAA